MLKREGFDFEKFAKKVRDSGSRVSLDSRFDPRAGYAGHLHVASGVHESIRRALSTRHVHAQVPGTLRAHADAAGARQCTYES